MIIGFILVKLNLVNYLRNYKVIGWTTIIFGILLYFCDQTQVKKSLNKNYSFNNDLFFDLYFFLTFIITFFIVIELNASKFGGWRHLYFLYQL